MINMDDYLRIMLMYSLMLEVVVIVIMMLVL